MNFETAVGLRYLRSKRKEAFISFTTWIAVIGIAIGVMALIIVIAVMTGFQNEIRSRILGINPHVLLLSATGEITDPAALVKTVKGINGVTDAFPFITFQAMAQNGTQMSGLMVKGINGEDGRSMAKLVKEGSIETLKKRGYVLMGKEIAKRLGLFVGDSFTVMVPLGGYSPMGATPETMRARVGGIFETGMYDIDNALIIMSLPDVQAVMGVGATGLEIKLDDVYKAKEVRAEIVRKIGSRFIAETWMERNKNLFSALKLEKLVMYILLGLIIFVASFNIITSLIMTVMEKKKDIAILKSIGARKASITKIFMIEGITIGVIGAVLGSLGGYIICEIIKKTNLISLPKDVYYITKLPAEIGIVDICLIGLITAVICVVATIYPSCKASKIDPVETLRYE